MSHALETQLTTLETSGLIRAADVEPELEYLFRHALIQDAAYGSLLKADRKILHRTVGETLERLFPDRRAELAPRLAEHFAQAEAITHYSRALEITGREPAARAVLLHLYTARGRAYELSDQHRQALDNYAEMEARANEQADPALQLAALMQRATLYSIPTSYFDPVQGEAASAQALELARQLTDRTAEAKIRWNLMLLYMNTGRYPQAVAAGEHSLALARELNLREQLAFTLNDLGMVYNYTGQRARAQAARREARDLLREQGNLPMLTDNLSNSAIAQFLNGQFEQAEATSTEAYRLSQATANLWGQAYSQGMLGFIYLERGEIQRAIAVMQTVLVTSEGAGLIMVLAGLTTDLACTYAWVGAAERGRDLIQLARQHVQSPLPPALRSWGLAGLARFSILTGDLTQAEADLRESYIGLNLNEWVWITPIIIGLTEAELALARHAPARALDVLDELLSRLRLAEVRAYAPEALYLKGRALLSLNQPEAAYTLLVEARVEAETMGARRMLWPILVALADLETQHGHAAEAHALRAQTRSLIAYIADHCPPDLRESFINLPDVRRVMSEE